MKIIHSIIKLFQIQTYNIDLLNTVYLDKTCNMSQGSKDKQLIIVNLICYSMSTVLAGKSFEY